MLHGAGWRAVYQASSEGWSTAHLVPLQQLSRPRCTSQPARPAAYPSLAPSPLPDCCLTSPCANNFIPPAPLWRQAQSELMARDLTTALQEVESSILRLPPMPASEAEEVAQAVVLMQQNADASAELAAELAAARAKLARLQDAHGALAEAALCHRAAAAAAAAADKAAAAAAAGKGGT